MPTASLSDFGLAKSVATGSRLTRTGEALGTPAYMSPEQARGDVSSLTSATDVWSLGCVLHEMLAGRPPFEGETPAALVGAILTRAAPPLRRLRPDVPRDLGRVLGACLRRETRERYTDVGSLRDDLGRLLAGGRPIGAPRGRWPSRAVVPALFLALAATAAAVLLGRGGGPVRPAGPSEKAAGSAEALAARARSLRASSPVEAARLLAEALAQEPGRDDWRLERGLVLWGAGENVRAREEWRLIPAGSPCATRAELYLGLEAFFREEEGLRFDQARPHLERAAAGAGADARLGSGALAAGRQRWDEARATLRDAPGWEAALLRGYVEANAPRGDRAAAERDLTSTLAEGIPFPWIYVSRAQVRTALGNAEGAIADSETALRLRPDDPGALLNRGWARWQLREVERAFRDFDAALRFRPAFPEALNNRGVARRERGDSDGAMRDLDQAIRLRPTYAEAFANRADTRAALGDLAGALEDYAESLRLRPGDALTLHNRGLARLNAGDPAAALQDFSEALTDRPDLVEAWNNRGLAHRHLGDLALAMEDFAAAIRLRPEDPGPHANLGDARFSSGDFQGAAECFRAVLRLAPDDPRSETVRRALALCEERLREGR
ncbi:MAG: tetratricopeptide repeat protein [Planctomycetales bacterium]|nr:tetratricopeptide repeat protein [Planctomycetales bacterium]